MLPHHRSRVGINGLPPDLHSEGDQDTLLLFIFLKRCDLDKTLDLAFVS